MKVYLVTANDRDWDAGDNHVAAVYSEEKEAKRIARRFNDAIDEAWRQQEASGKITIYESLEATLKAMGDERANVIDRPRYDVEEFEVDPERP